jgi:hypothetical protein
MNCERLTRRMAVAVGTLPERVGRLAPKPPRPRPLVANADAWGQASLPCRQLKMRIRMLYELREIHVSVTVAVGASKKGRGRLAPKPPRPLAETRMPRGRHPYLADN